MRKEGEGSEIKDGLRRKGGEGRVEEGRKVKEDG